MTPLSRRPASASNGRKEVVSGFGAAEMGGSLPADRLRPRAQADRSLGRHRPAMESVLELRLLASLAAGAAPPHVVARHLRRPPDDLYAPLRRLEQRGCLQRLRGRAYRLTTRRACGPSSRSSGCSPEAADRPNGRISGPWPNLGPFGYPKPTRKVPEAYPRPTRKVRACPDAPMAVSDRALVDAVRRA